MSISKQRKDRGNYGIRLTTSSGHAYMSFIYLAQHTEEASPPMTTGAKAAPEFKEGESVTIKTGVHSGKSGKVTKILPTQGTNRGVESRHLYKTSSSPEYYRAADLQKG